MDAVVSGTDLPELGEEPADVVNGLVHGVGPDSVLTEVDWIDLSPAVECLTALLDAAGEALGGNRIYQPHYRNRNMMIEVPSEECNLHSI